ncbi:MAG TPA: HepT-like ribonuclease domain-containing protein [Polyangia bacterium]
MIRQLAIVGEAAKNLSSKTKDKYPGVAWRDIGRLRDLVVHDYWKIGVAEIWNIATTDIPSLLETLR